jgi:transposase
MKLGQVASDVLGMRGRLRLRALAEGERDASKLAGVAPGKLRSKAEELRRALTGHLTVAQGGVLRELLTRLPETAAAVERVAARIREEGESCADPFVKTAGEVLDSRPGVGEPVAQTIIAERGVDMDRFGSAERLASWAGMCPGKNESAGKRRRGPTTKGSKYLRTALIEAAGGATRTKGTFLAARYQRLIKRMPKKKALVAIGHGILSVGYPLLRRRVGSTDLGGEYFTHQHVEQQRQRLVKKLEALGVKVTLEEVAHAA